jgi:regulator of sigma E protease
MIIFLYGVLGFIILVFFHELGHFLAAKSVGMKVDAFAIGMGPTLLEKKYKDTVYKLCLIPLGGYCAIKGQDDFGSVQRNNEKDSFFGKGALARFWVVAAGPLFSFILGFIFISFTFMINGETRLKYTKLDPPSRSSLFKPQDEVMKVNGKNVQYWDEVTMQLLSNIGEPNNITVKRGNKNVEIKNYIFDPNEKDPLKSDFTLFYRQGPTMIQKVKANSPADKAGLILGDIIVSINNNLVRTDFNVLQDIASTKETVTMIIHRYPKIMNIIKKDPQFYKNPQYHYETLQLKMRPEVTNDSQKRKVIGITGLYTFPGKEVKDAQEYRAIGFMEGLKEGLLKSKQIMVLNAKGILKLLQGNKIIAEGLSGPIKIFYQVGKLSEINGFMIFLNIIGVISLSLAFFNLLPFPALDGGHMLITIIEAIRRKPINIKILNIIQTVGIFLLLLLFIFVSIRDVISFF